MDLAIWPWLIIFSTFKLCWSLEFEFTHDLVKLSAHRMNHFTDTHSGTRVHPLDFLETIQYFSLTDLFYNKHGELHILWHCWPLSKPISDLVTHYNWAAPFFPRVWQTQMTASSAVTLWWCIPLLSRLQCDLRNACLGLGFENTTWAQLSLSLSETPSAPRNC